MTQPPERAISETVVVRASAQLLYDLVSDVTRMGEFSPTCTSCWWDEGNGPTIEDWFTGRNQTPDRTWETRSQVFRNWFLNTIREHTNLRPEQAAVAEFGVVPDRDMAGARGAAIASRAALADTRV